MTEEVEAAAGNHIRPGHPVEEGDKHHNLVVAA